MKQWLAKYETLTSMVVPRSSTFITEDNEYCLYNVTLFKKVLEDFKLKCQNEKFQVRDFVFSADQMAKEKVEYDEVNAAFKEQTVISNPLMLQRNLTILFSSQISLDCWKLILERPFPSGFI